jgi:UDP-glucose 4-epimerase
MEGNIPEKIIIFSRDEAKQHAMRLRFQNLTVATDETIYNNFRERVQFIIGDIRDFHSIRQAIKDIDIIFHTAAIKQVPTAEYFPQETIKTNVLGAENLVSAIIESDEPIECVVGISTDKACHPSTAYGMTKAMMERIFIAANLRCDHTSFVLTRYGNVMGSTGSVLPLFQNQIENGKPLTVTSPDMTRFMMDINQSVDIIFSAYAHANDGDILVPKIPSSKIIDVAQVMGRKTKTPIKMIGIRPGEKLHEMLISPEEIQYTTIEKEYFIIHPMLPELARDIDGMSWTENQAYTSQQDTIEEEQLIILLIKQGWIT